MKTAPRHPIASPSRSSAAARFRPGARSALIVVDVQNDFLPGGALPVARGDEVIPVIARIARAFDNIVLTQDWHPPGHLSFASSHAGKKPFDSIELDYGAQTLWPDHCVQGSAGAALHPGLPLSQAQLILRKGFDRQIDSYSAFEEADRKTATGLAGYLRQRGIDTVFIAGLATDFCVAWTALDARRLGFASHVVEDACRGIDLGGSLPAAWQQMQTQGVERIRSGDIDGG